MNTTASPQLAGAAFVPRAYAALFGLGGLLVLGTMGFDHAPDRHLGFMAVPAVAALGLAVSLLVFARRIPERASWLLPQFGSLCVASVVYGAGAQLRVTYAMLFVWSITSGFYFFPRAIAWSNLPTAAALYLTVLLATHQPHGGIDYVVTVVIVAVIAALIDRLNVQRNRLSGELDETLSVLREQALTDPVTGLPNRREFARHLNREVARAQRGGLPLALVMIDLDRFKEYNDTYGHPAGDDLLQEVARTWGSRLRAGDLLVRYGGDEFAAVLPDCRIADAHRLAARLRAPLPEGQTCSVGVAAWAPSESGEQLIARADADLLRVKRRRRTQTGLAEDEPLQPA